MTNNARSRLRPRLVRWLRRGVTLAIVVAVSAYVLEEGQRIDWDAVADTATGYGLATLAVAVLLSVPSQLACACFDLIGRHATRHKLSVPRVMLISYTGYFFSLNLGALVGGLAFRYHLYAPHKLPAAQIGQIIALSVLTNWSGYVLLAGIVLSYAPPDLPQDWGPGTAALRGLGFVLLGVAGAYIVLCATRGGMSIRWRDSWVRLPTLRIAALQLTLSVVSWSSMGMIIAWLIPGGVGWLDAMPVLMVSAIAGVWSHVPGGLGVIELVFLTMLDHRVASSRLLGAILIFRLIYYLLPFALSLAAYAGVRVTAKSAAER